MKRENYHIISIRDSEDFVQTITEDLHAKDGIAISVGKLKSKLNEPPVTQEFLFDKNKWDLEDAQKWVEENKDVFDIMLDKPNKEKSMEPITKIYDCEIKDFNEKERTFKAIASTEAVDRDGDILRAKGWKLQNYKKNPQGLWSHMAFMPPIFKTIAVGINENNQLEFVPQFVPKEIDEFADKIFQLYKNKFLKAFSVRFLPFKWEEIPPKQDAKPGERRTYGKDYKSQELLEISSCTVPANPECLSNKSFQDIVLTNKKLEYISTIEDEVKQKEMLAEFNRDLGELIEPDNDEQKPYPNEHSCRVKDPGAYKTCRRTSRTSNGKKYFILTCQRKDDPSKWEEQAYRYPKDSWSVAEARKHCTEHDGIKFEPASKSEDSDGIGNSEKAKYNCECIKCGHKITSDKHCNTLKCPKCGGEMRRVERPGPGRSAEGIINITVQDIDKIKPLLNILKSGRVISEKNRKLIAEAIAQIEKTAIALKGLLAISEPERSIDDIINEVKNDINNEEVSKEDIEKLIKIIEKNQTVINSLDKNKKEE